jgi:transposase
MTLPYAYQQTQRLRGLDLLSRFEDPVVQVSRNVFRVHSESGRGYYTVRKTPKGWTCECPAFEEGSAPCKHIWASRIWLKPGLYSTLGKSPRHEAPVYTQDWPAYDAAQQAEHILFDPLLWSLLDDVPEPLREPGTLGRRPIPLRTQLLVAIKKVHLGKSTRACRGMLEVDYASGKGLLVHVPNYAVPSRLFNRPDVGQTFLELIRRSAEPLRELEDGGTVAIDSTGFCTTCMGSYCTEMHDPGRRHRWVKAHVIVGVRTHIIIDVRVTDERGADCPQFVPLLLGANAAGFTPVAVVADKAYLSRENYTTAAGLGLSAYIPFKSNSTGGMRGSFVWRKMFHAFQLHREDFERKYHPRSNVEAVFSAIKRKLGEALLSKNPLARFNEMLAKLLAYNIGVLVHEIYEHGIDPSSIGLPPRAPTSTPPGGPGSQIACDSMQLPVTNLGEPN